MRKTLKLIKNPNLFFRDYFLKKEPISYGHGVVVLDSEQAKTADSRAPTTTKKVLPPSLKLLTNSPANSTPKPTASAKIKQAPIQVKKPLANAAPAGLPTQLSEDLYPVVFPIDVVYTWVDADDPAFTSEKRKFETKFHQLQTAKNITKPEIFDIARFKSRDELKYSLRSLHAFAPWINKIYIVTNGQVPKWLDTADSKVEIVKHSEILSSEFLPTFNSHVIESSLHKIKNLSEHYLYLNDDVLLTRPVSPNYFFWSNGRAKLYITDAKLPNGPKGVYDTPTQWAAKNARSLIYSASEIMVTNMFAHTFHPQLRSVHERMEDMFSAAYAECRKNRFRAATDLPIATFLHHHLSHIQGASTLHRTSCMYFNIRTIFAKQCYKSLLARKGTDQAPYSMCLNDHVSEGNAFMPDYEQRLREFLDEYFPNPAPYETASGASPISNRST